MQHQGSHRIRRVIFHYPNSVLMNNRPDWIHSLQSPDLPHTSTGASSDSQSILIAELQKINQRFGKLEEQAAMDRLVLSGLVSQFKHHTTASNRNQSASVSNTQVQKFSSTKNSKQGSSGSVKGQVESHKEGQHSRVHLTKQQQVAITGATCKVSTSQVNSVTYIQPVSKCSVPFQGSVYMSDVQSVSGQHSVLRMMPSNRAYQVQGLYPTHMG